MCGLVALIDRAGKIQDSLVEGLRDTLTHRGPDDAGTWIEREGLLSQMVGLGHRRLSILDLSAAGHQPMHSPDGRYVLVYNGELYNYLELRAELAQAGLEFSSTSDSEVLLQAFARWGPAALERFNGMFAFAIWDRRERRMFCARDRFGEKPLFYAFLPDGRGLVLGSEIKALLAHPDVPAQPDLEVAAEFLTGQYREEYPYTTFVGVKRLLPGHAMWISADGRIERLWRYWTINHLHIDRRISRERALEEFRRRLLASIRLRLRADVQVGSSLSGGLDSSWIVGGLTRLAQGHGGMRVNTFSARFDDDPTMSEGPDIDRVLEHTGAKGHFVTPDPQELQREARALHYHQEEPFLSTSIYLQWCVARLAKENGTTILIDGQGADELLGGYASYFSLYQRDLVEQGRLWRATVDSLRFMGRLRLRALTLKDLHRRIGRPEVLGFRELLRRRLTPDHAPQSRYAVGVPPPSPSLRFRQRRAEALFYDNLPTLLRYADRNAMAFAREPRLPFLDHTLVEFVCTLPDDYLLHRGWQKWILRETGKDLIPPKTQWRADKVGYAAPQDAWLRGALRPWMEERLFESPVSDVPGFDRGMVEDLWRRHVQGEDQSWTLWRCASLGEWLSMFKERAWAPQGDQRSPVVLVVGEEG